MTEEKFECNGRLQRQKDDRDARKREVALQALQDSRPKSSKVAGFADFGKLAKVTRLQEAESVAIMSVLRKRIRGHGPGEAFDEAFEKGEKIAESIRFLGTFKVTLEIIAELFWWQLSKGELDKVSYNLAVDSSMVCTRLYWIYFKDVRYTGSG